NSVDQIEKLDKVARRTFGLNVAEHSRHRRRDTRRRAVRASVARSNLVLQTIIASNETDVAAVLITPGVIKTIPGEERPLSLPSCNQLQSAHGVRFSAQKTRGML